MDHSTVGEACFIRIASSKYHAENKVHEVNCIHIKKCQSIACKINSQEKKKTFPCKLDACHSFFGAKANAYLFYPGHASSSGHKTWYWTAQVCANIWAWMAFWMGEEMLAEAELGGEQLKHSNMLCQGSVHVRWLWCVMSYGWAHGDCDRMKK